MAVTKNNSISLIILSIFLISTFISVKCQYYYNPANTYNPNTYNPYGYNYNYNYGTPYMNYPYYTTATGLPAAVTSPVLPVREALTILPAPAPVPVPVQVPVVQNVVTPAVVSGGINSLAQAAQAGHYEIYQYGRSGIENENKTEHKNNTVTKIENPNKTELVNNPNKAARFVRPFNLFGTQRHFEVYRYGPEILLPVGGTTVV